VVLHQQAVVLDQTAEIHHSVWSLLLWAAVLVDLLVHTATTVPLVDPVAEVRVLVQVLVARPPVVRVTLVATEQVVLRVVVVVQVR
jgi:hypothetical protein